MKPIHALPVAIAATLALVGCPGPSTNPTPAPSGGASLDQSALSTDASGVINSLSDFETSLSQQSADVSSAEDTGAGTSIQSLSFGPQYSVQADVDVNLGASFNFGTPIAANLAGITGWTEVKQPAVNTSFLPGWIYNGTANPPVYYYPRAQQYGSIAAATEDIYISNTATSKAGPFAWYHVTTHNGAVVEENFAPESAATDSVAGTSYPTQFSSLLPAAYRIRQAQLNFFTYGASGSTAVGYRWAVHDASASGKPLVAWVRALKISRPNNVTVNHYDISTAYASIPDWRNPSGATHRLPTELINDDVNTTANTHYHTDKTYNSANTTWTGNGYFVAADGSKRTTQETWNIATNTRTRTVSWTGKGGAALVMTLNYAADRSGTGTITGNGTQFATMTWGTNGQGKMTLASGQTLNFKAHY